MWGFGGGFKGLGLEVGGSLGGCAPHCQAHLAGSS